MIINGKRPKLRAFIISIFVIFFGILFGIHSFSEWKEDNKGLDSDAIPDFIVFQENTLIAFSNPSNPTNSTFEVVKKIQVIITAYSSTPGQTDDSPFITAAGTFVREGIVANNLLPFGTEIRIPELYEDRIFIVEDRMSWKKGDYHIDIWFPEYSEALAFGAKRAHIEVLER